MPNTLDEQMLSCPYCGEIISVLVDCSVLDQDYIEDCQVCCRPMLISVCIEGEQVFIQARQEND